MVTGGRAENAALLEKSMTSSFSPAVRAWGGGAAPRGGTSDPTVLELGGKSPCIVDCTANLRLAAKRIVFGKYLNCGQTCVAPDYILCEVSIKDALVAELQTQIRLQYGDPPLSNPDYGHIVNEKHFDRLCGLLDQSKLSTVERFAGRRYKSPPR